VATAHGRQRAERQRLLLFLIRQTHRLDILRSLLGLPRNVRVPLQTDIYGTTAPRGSTRFTKAVLGTVSSLHTLLAILLLLVVVAAGIAETAAAGAQVEFWLQTQTSKSAQHTPLPLVLAARSMQLAEALPLGLLLRQTGEALAEPETQPVVAVVPAVAAVSRRLFNPGAQALPVRDLRAEHQQPLMAVAVAVEPVQ
jgi:hypothetical protein